MNMFGNVVSDLVNQEVSLTAMNNESVIHLLGLEEEKVEQNRLLDDIVAHLGLDSFNKPTDVVPDTGTSFGYDTTVQGQQLPLDYAPVVYSTPVYSYVDFSPVETHNSPNHESTNYLTPQETYHEENTFVPTPSVEPLLSSHYLTPPSSPEEVSSSILPPPPVANPDTHKPAATGKSSRSRNKRELKTKLYQCEQPRSNPEEEKKRLNAINAKKNRDKQKNRMQELENLVASLTAQKETLQTSNNKLKRKCDAFEKQLVSVCQQLKVPVVILPQE